MEERFGTSIPASPETETAAPQRAAMPEPSANGSALATGAGPAPSLIRALGPLVGWAAAACLLTLINVYAGAIVPLPTRGLGAQALAIPYLLLLLWCLLSIARAAARLPVGGAFEAIAGLVLALPQLARLLLSGLAAVRPQFAPALAAVNDVYALLLPGIPELINNFFGTIGLALLGSAVGRIIKHPNTLLAGAGFASFFDIVVVTMGTVAQLLRSNPTLIAAVSVGAGSPTPGGGGHGPPWLHRTYSPISTVTIGPADVLFLAVFLAAVHRMNLSRRTTIGWMFGLLGAALLLVQTVPGLPIPALAPMGAAVLIANRRHAAFTPQERRDLKIGAVFALFCAGLMVFAARRLAPPAPAAPGPPLGFAFDVPEKPPLLLTVRQIQPGSRAEKAGLRPGDQITGIGESSFATMAPEQVGGALLAARASGGAFTIRRQGKGQPVTVTLPAAPKNAN